MTTHATESLIAKSMVLLAINIFQPCKKDILANNLKKYADSNQLDNILAQLLKEKRVTCERDYFRLTLKGMDSITPGKGRILRDLQRMEYLSQLYKKGGVV